jgi:hypothetical protein
MLLLAMEEEDIEEEAEDQTLELLEELISEEDVWDQCVLISRRALRAAWKSERTLRRLLRTIFFIVLAIVSCVIFILSVMFIMLLLDVPLECIMRIVRQRTLVIPTS